jgi:regulatory protein
LRLALRYLARRSRSEAEVRRYLNGRGCARGAAESAIEKLRSLNYLNDESFAHTWARARAQGQSYGPGRIEQELRGKGLGQSLIRQALRETFNEVDETKQAQRLLDRHFKGGNLAEPKTLRRAAAFLQRRGYGSKVVFNLLRYSIEED